MGDIHRALGRPAVLVLEYALFEDEAADDEFEISMLGDMDFADPPSPAISDPARTHAHMPFSTSLPTQAVNMPPQSSEAPMRRSPPRHTTAPVRTAIPSTTQPTPALQPVRKMPVLAPRPAAAVAVNTATPAPKRAPKSASTVKSGGSGHKAGGGARDRSGPAPPRTTSIPRRNIMHVPAPVVVTPAPVVDAPAPVDVDPTSTVLDYGWSLPAFDNTVGRGDEGAMTHDRQAQALDPIIHGMSEQSIMDQLRQLPVPSEVCSQPPLNFHSRRQEPRPSSALNFAGFVASSLSRP